jgi:hypothetical protein
MQGLENLGQYSKNDNDQFCSKNYRVKLSTLPAKVNLYKSRPASKSVG